MKKKLVSILLTGLMATLCLGGCSSSTPDTSGSSTVQSTTATTESTSSSSSSEATTSSGGTIKIGTISPNTGSMAAYGDAVTKAWKLAAKEINAAGGVNGYQIALVEKDDQMDPTETLNAFNALVAEDVTAILGSVSSGCTSAITAAANEEAVILVTPTSTADSITTKDDYVFRTCYADSFQGKIAAKYAADKGFSEIGRAHV